ncbi:MAG: GtrA family protein [Alphaproteobacteria bacterium]
MIKKWFSLNDKIRFSIMCSFNMSIKYALFILLGILFSTFHYQIILALSWFLSSVLAFYCYKILVFQSQGEHIKEFCKSILVWTISYIINAFCLEFLVTKCKLHPNTAQAIIIGSLFIINYFLFKHFAFKTEKNWCKKIYDKLF